MAVLNLHEWNGLLVVHLDFVENYQYWQATQGYYQVVGGNLDYKQAVCHIVYYHADFDYNLGYFDYNLAGFGNGFVVRQGCKDYMLIVDDVVQHQEEVDNKVYQDYLFEVGSNNSDLIEDYDNRGYSQGGNGIGQVGNHIQAVQDRQNNCVEWMEMGERLRSQVMNILRNKVCYLCF